MGYFFCRVWNVHTGEMLNTLIHHCEAVLHLRFQEGMMVTCSKVNVTCLFRRDRGRVPGSKEGGRSTVGRRRECGNWDSQGGRNQEKIKY